MTTSPPSCVHRFLLVSDSGQPPTADSHVGVCQHCGQFLVRLVCGRSQVMTTFRLTKRQLRAAEKGVSR